MSNGEHEIRTPKGLRIGNRSVVDGKNMPEKKKSRWKCFVTRSMMMNYGL